MTEALDHARSIAKAVKIHTIADVDTGFGNAVNVTRTVKEFVHSGVSAIMMEDQPFPKRQGETGTPVISSKEMVLKIKAAIEARGNDDLSIIAKTNSRKLEGLEEAINRANAYAEAGAEAILVVDHQSKDEIGILSQKIRAPVAISQHEGRKMPLIPAKELDAMGAQDGYLWKYRIEGSGVCSQGNPKSTSSRGIDRLGERQIAYLGRTAGTRKKLRL